MQWEKLNNKIRKADKLARKYLGNAKKALGKKEAFYIALEKALHNYLKAKLHIETSDLSKDKVVNLLKDKKVDDAVVSDFVSIIKNTAELSINSDNSFHEYW